MADQSLKDLYKVISENHKRDITSSTSELVKKAHPRSPIVLDLEKELFDLEPELIKRLPLKAIEALDHALKSIIGATDTEPQLRQALRKFINKRFTQAEQEEKDENLKTESEKISEEILVETYKEFLKILTETKAAKFNYKMFLDIEPNKIMNPFFVQLLNTFELETLSRMQKQGVLLFLKKLADLADGNPVIAQALNRIVRIEKIATDNIGELDEI